jgi:hypothetical protein
MSASKTQSALPVLGWREWVSLPELATPWIKVKIDTGARSCALHAFDIEYFDRDNVQWVRFEIHPWQRSANDLILQEAPVIEERNIRSSSGETETRPVISTSLGIGDAIVPIELTLTRRDEMGFRMLVGREALRRRYLVDPSKSFVAGRAPRAVRSANRQARR